LARKKRKERRTAQAARHYLHQFRKRSKFGPKCPSPMEKITSEDLEGGWQTPAPDQGLESIFFKCGMQL